MTTRPVPLLRPDDTPSRHRASGIRRAAGSSAAGVLGATVATVAFAAVLEPGALPSTPAEALSAGVEILSHAAVMAAAVLVGALLLLGACGALSRRWTSAGVAVPLAGAGLVGVLLLRLNADNLAGAWLASHPLRWPFVVGIELAVGVGALALGALAAAALGGRHAPFLVRVAMATGAAAWFALLLSAAALAAPRSPSTAALGLLGAAAGPVAAHALLRRRISRVPSPRLAGAGLGLLGAAAIAADGCLLTGIYPGFHRGLLVVSVLSLVAGAAACWTSRRLHAIAGFAAIVVLAAGLAAGLRQRGGPSGSEAAARAAVLSGVLAPALPLTERVLELLAPRAALPRGDPAEWAQVLERIVPDAGGPAAPAAVQAARDWNVVVLSIDAVRADVTGFTGVRFPAAAGRSATPGLDRFAAGATVFERARTTYPTSSLAYASLFTGLHPRATPTARAVAGTGGSGAGPQSLPAFVRAAGIRSAAVSAYPESWRRDPELLGCLAAEFDVFDAAGDPEQETAEHVAEASIRHIRRLAGERFLLWTTFFDAHEPYDGPPPGGGPDGPEGRYLGDVARADAGASRILDVLRELRLLDRTIVVVHADHGEAFGEHGHRTHNSNLHEPQTHVPLVIGVPGLQPRRIPETVSLADVLPTLLDLLGIPVPAGRTGRSLVPLLRGGRAPEGGVAFAELLSLTGSTTPSQAVWLGRWKAIRRLDYPALAVHDLVADPGERRNLLGADGAVDGRLLALMEAFDRRIGARGASSRRPGPDPALLAPEVLPRIEALLDAGAPVPAEPILAASDVLCTRFLTPRRSVVARAGPDRLRSILARLAARIDEDQAADPAVIGAISKLLGGLGCVDARDRLAARFRDRPEERALLAAGLACLGDPAVQPFLRAALGEPAALRPDLTALLLARTGDPAARPWVERALRSGEGDLLGAALAAAGAFGDAALLAAARERLRDLEGLSEDVLAAASDLLAGDASAEALEFRAAVAGRSSREGPHAEPAGDAWPPSIREELPAAAHEAEAHRFFAAGSARDAADRWQRSANASRLPRVEARFRAAEAFRLAGLPAEASRVLQALASVAGDRGPAERIRRTRQTLGDPPILPREGLRLHVRLLDPPAALRAGQSFALRVAVTNAGPWRLPGGPAPFGCRLDLVFDRCEAPPPAMPGDWTWGGLRLPDEGLMPGETRELTLIEIAPAAVPGAGVSLVLSQDGGVPGGAVVWRL